jgi:hypothetical protein
MQSSALSSISECLAHDAIITRMSKESTRQPTGPMTLGNMRSLGPRDLRAWCKACDHHSTVNECAYPDHIGVPSFCPRTRCSKCGRLGASLRPDSTDLRAAPKQ